LVSRTDAQANLLWERTYEDATGRLDAQTIKSNITQATLASFDLSYDLAGNVTSKNQSVFTNGSNGLWTYQYDGASRMTRAELDYPGSTPSSTRWDYAYDGAGNRTKIKQSTLPSTVTSDVSTTYDAAGLATTATDAVTAETITYTHDKIGSLTVANSATNANDWARAYDAYGRMSCAKPASTACTSGTTRVLPTYDALDRTASQTSSGTTTTFAWRGVEETLSYRKVGTGSPTAYVNSAGGTPIAEKQTSAYLYLRDPLELPRLYGQANTTTHS
jgi:hypothetical protein